MPTENERKYVLNRERDPIRSLRKLQASCRSAVIYQGYLAKGKGLTVRARHIVDSEKNVSEYKLTVKLKTGERVVENEMEIDSRDFSDYWNRCENKLEKVRVYLEGWEVDYFLDSSGEVYFVLAEHEMPEGQEDPERIPDFVKERLLFEVPRLDDRFTNRKLSQVEYARKLWSSLES